MIEISKILDALLIKEPFFGKYMSWNGAGEVNQSLTISYSFPTSMPSYYSQVGWASPTFWRRIQDDWWAMPTLPDLLLNRVSTRLFCLMS